jgi:hypothetical protein
MNKPQHAECKELEWHMVTQNIAKTNCQRAIEQQIMQWKLISPADNFIIYGVRG